MSRPKIHFSFEPDKNDLKVFVESLMADFGQAQFGDADVIVSVGGDGSLLHVLRRAENGQKVFGLVPPGSNSRGFWTNNIIRDSEALSQQLKTAQSYDIAPLKAVIRHKDGMTTLLKAFNEVAPSENCGQAMLVELAIRRANGKGIEPIRIMGDGLILSTAFGSTALNRTYGGSAIDIRNSGIAVAGKGIYEPHGFGPIVADDGVSFEIKFLSPAKRPVRVLYDGISLQSKTENPFQSMSIEKDKDFAIKLMLVDDPATRAFSAIMPKL